ncbi:hypothetical protein EWM64_g7077, partial [Hericium alpestre]
MGKNKCAAKAAWRAAARAAPPLPTTANIRHLLIATITLVDTPSASAVRESPMTTQQLRVSHEADATCASRAASSVQPTIDASLVLEPATAEAQAPMPVAIATPQTHEHHTSDSCPESHGPPPALTKPTSTSNDVTPSSHQLPPVSTHTDMLITLRTPIPTLSASAATAVMVLTAAITVMGPPILFLACPMHVFCHAEDFSHESESLAPHTSPAMSVEEIDEDLLDNIIEDAQNEVRIEIHREVRLKALAEGRERGWKEGLDEGKEIARREVRRNTRAEMCQQEQGRKDVYELGRWAGYCEGLEVVRTEVSTIPRIDATVQADDATLPHPGSINTSPVNPRIDAHVQTDNTPCPHSPPLPSLHANSPPPTPVDTTTATPHANADVQTNNHTPTLSPPACTCDPTPRFNPVTPCVDTGVQSDAPARALTPTTCVHVGMQVDSPAQPTSSHLGSHTPLVTGVCVHDMPPHLSSPSSDNARTSMPARMQTVHEIDHGLLREIIATASAKGEAAGLKKGKHSDFQEGMEAGRRSGTREGHAEGLRKGREQYRLE